MSLPMQVKLLRVLQERVFERIGSNHSTPCNVRVVAATHRDLEQAIKTKEFREDLFYRLNVINISLPPLRDRKVDIPLLTRAILGKLAGDAPVPSVAPRTMQLLAEYGFPGNVRELENILERALVLGGEVLLPEHLPEVVRDQVPQKLSTPHTSPMRETHIIEDENLELPIQLDELLARIERHYLEVALLKSNGVKKKAAELLGMNFRSFRYRLQKFDLNE
jgi:two-component system response regulator PilR (NtrC family)